MASTSSRTPSSSGTSFSTTPTTWDVFLSFRGKDTRLGFTSHLYSALDRYNIRTFMDDPELRCGEVISAALIQAIHESKVHIVVLSENYASSSWCLNELVEILNCNKTMQRLVIPVFYNIDPTVVRYQTRSFKKDFKRHEIRYAGEMERVKNWRLALRQVADNSGKHVDGKRSEADIVNEIVDEILPQIKPNALDVARYPVGLKSRVDDIVALLSSGKKGVIKIGLYGMGGVGKTTLAKALFNKLLPGSFEGSCFLGNVREISGTLKGVESLQQQLINDVLHSKNKVQVSSAHQGTKLIETKICSKKILVVIDDLDDHKEFKSLVGPFASGSLVIITARNEETLDSIEIETRYRYKVNELSFAKSETLFFQHAFGDTKPSNNLVILSKDILRLAGGLPLALEVFGSYLYNKSEVRWKSYIETLQRNPNSSIHQRLIISLDALESDDPLLKKMFLDIACLFIGMNKKKVVEILDTYYPYADDKIDILKKRCLLTINDSNELRMHDLLQEMGKKIARNNSPDEPGKHSRLWVSKDIFYVLEGHKGTEAIEGILLHCFESKDSFESEDGFKSKNGFLHSFESEDGFESEYGSKELNQFKEVSFATETFKGMSKLRFLYLDDIDLTGKFERTLENLRWFCWNRCPLRCLPSDFFPQKLVILELPHSRMTTMWEVNMVSNVFGNLKTLNMSFSQYLTTTPDFRRLPCLENLYLEGCTSLEEVHISIGSLVSLISLNLKGCVNLRSLPDTICKLKALEVLCIEGCYNLERLPDQLWKLTGLSSLDASCIHMKKLPDIESSQTLFSLTWLNLSESKITALPSRISQLLNLEYLGLKCCSHLLSIAELPPNLKYIDASTCMSLERVSLSNLKLLEILNLEYCSASTEILGLEELTSLKKLYLRGCRSTLLGRTLTKPLFQIYSGFEQEIGIYLDHSFKFPNWIIQSSVEYSAKPDHEWARRCRATLWWGRQWSQNQGHASLSKGKRKQNEGHVSAYLNLKPNLSHNYQGMILCFDMWNKRDILDYYVLTSESNILRSVNYIPELFESRIAIVPRSVFTVTDTDHRIIVRSNTRRLWVHPLYKNEDDNTTVSDLEVEGGYPSKRFRM